ncbi:MAG: hypothetical protein ACI8X5_000784 [Planctomycetota bacterium]
MDGWFVGGRADLYSLEIDWVQNPGTGSEQRGNTDILILQPTVLGGYRWKLGDSAWNFEISAAAGAEINVISSGEDVGQGAIGLIGVGLTYSL